MILLGIVLGGALRWPTSTR